MTFLADRVTNVPVSFRQLRMKDAEGALQEGVVGATDLKIVQRAAGADQSVDFSVGAAYIRIDSGTRNGLVHVYNDAVANIAATAANGTNPRVDIAVVRYNDSSIPAGTGGNTPTPEIIAGTATAGAQVITPGAAGYRAGAPALPNDCMLVADILRPTATNPITTTNIVDRRPWARGAYTRLLRTAGDRTTVSSTFVDLDSTAMVPRIECSGVPVTVSLRGRSSQGALPSALLFQLLVDGAVTGRGAVRRGILSGGADDFDVFWNLSLAAGSHVIKPQYALEAGSTTGTVFSTATNPLEFEISETVRQVADNGT